MNAISLAAAMTLAATAALACGASITDEYGGRMLQTNCGGLEMLSPNYVTGSGTSRDGTRYTPQIGGGVLVQRRDGGMNFAPPDYSTGGYLLPGNHSQN
jgi:hypothetical protein